LGDEGCYAHEVVWDWSFDAWRDNNTRPADYYDQDPYWNCPNAEERRGPSWGDNFSDGGGYLYWDYVAELGDDIFAVVEREADNCPLCAWLVIAAAVAEDPEVEEEAAAIGETAEGLAERAVLAWEQNGPQISAQIHHIMTDKNWVAGPQWSQRFAQLLQRVGMTLADDANRVLVWDHVGPHPQEYHQYVWDRVLSVIEGGGNADAVKALLQEIARECVTEGTTCNNLITR
jgi:hypothetical protein